jgi:transcriptional regulator with XRE-family HTH domain
MIRNEAEYQEVSKRLAEELRRLDEHRSRLKAAGLEEIEIQRDLARRLGVHETQVSSDERNEYFGITLERAAKILDALNVRLRT